ncbi:MAG TPA: DUF3108 domain-containing protein [Terriglobales bacterium]|nr:DUF3108 domain-containing protein [Terriglobales bacterium]
MSLSLHLVARRVALLLLLASATMDSGWSRAAQQQTAPAQAPAESDTAPRIRPPQAGYRFPDGHAWIYSVEWRIFPAGMATLRTDAAGAERRVTASVDSVGAAALLYRVRDRFESFFDPATFCSHHIAKHTEEGSRRLETSIRFDSARQKAVLEEQNLRSGQSKRTEHEIPGCVTDVLSALYYLRTLPLEPGAVFMFPLNDGSRTVEVTARVEAREEIRTAAGTFSTVRVRPEAPEGTVRSHGQIWIWYSDDEQRIPVQMRARLFFGTLTFRLERVESKPVS